MFVQTVFTLALTCPLASVVARADPSPTPPAITIPQSGTPSPDFQFGRCGADVAEIIAHMRAHPGDFDPAFVRILILSNVVVGKEWALHVVVYDGRGHIYDPSLDGSRTAKPVLLWRYLMSVSRANDPTEVRVVAPDEWIAHHAVNSVRAFEIFGAGLNVMKGYWRYVVSEAEWRALGPIQTPHSLDTWLDRGQFEAREPTDLILNWRTLFPKRRQYVARWKLSTPGRLMRLVRQSGASVNDAVAAAAWVNFVPDLTRRYFDLVLKHEAELSRNPESRFNLDRLFDGQHSERPWRDHPLRRRLRTDCTHNLSGEVPPNHHSESDDSPHEFARRFPEP